MGENCAQLLPPEALDHLGSKVKMLATETRGSVICSLLMSLQLRGFDQ